MDIYFVDVQFYQHENQHIVKEATLYPITTPENYQHFVFKSPFLFASFSSKDKKTNHFIYSVLGVLHWSAGIQSLSDFCDAIPPNSIILCNGQEKVQSLIKLLPHVSRIFNIFVSFNKIDCSILCNYPAQHKQCSYTNCLKMMEFFKCNQ